MELLTDDELALLAAALSPRASAPHAALALCACCHAFRAALRATTRTLRTRYETLRALCRKFAVAHPTHLVASKLLVCRALDFAAPDCDALADAFGEGLRCLQLLSLNHSLLGDEGVATLVGRLPRDALPALQLLYLERVEVGDAGAVALGGALARGAMPLLQSLHLANNRFGCVGMVAMAPALRTHPLLYKLDVRGNWIGGEGIEALASPADGVLSTLRRLDVSHNPYGLRGLAALRALLLIRPALSLLA